MQFFSLDEIVESDSVVRVLDLFCKCIDYEKLGFIVKGKYYDGKTAFETQTLTAIYIYGYLNKIRSCRSLEKAWLKRQFYKGRFRRIQSFYEGQTLLTFK